MTTSQDNNWALTQTSHSPLTSVSAPLRRVGEAGRGQETYADPAQGSADVLKASVITGNLVPAREMRPDGLPPML